MTTKVTVDAHAGWPVRVVKVQLNEDGTRGSLSEETVLANTVQDFYVHSHLELEIKEMTMPPPEPTQA